MKKHWKKMLVTALAALLVILLCATVPKAATASADTEGMSSYIVYSYNISCTLNTDCSADITELIDITYVGHFTRTIPLDDGVRAKNVRLYNVTDGDDGEIYTEANYSVKSDKKSVTIESRPENGPGTETFVITYSLVNLPLTSSKSDDQLDIINIGSGWSDDIRYNRASISLVVPDGFIAEGSALFLGTKNDFDAQSYAQCEEYMQGNNMINYSPETLSAGTGMSFWLRFDKGVMSSGTGDILPWLLLLVGLAIIAAALAIRFTVFRKNRLFDGKPGEGKRLCGKKSAMDFPKNAENKDAEPETHDAETPADGSPRAPLDAPSPELDPLTMRRVLECKIEDRDVVSLLFYWAEKGYIRISVKNAENPVFIKGPEPLPENCPDSWKNLYAGIFGKTDRASIKSVNRRIYPKVAGVKQAANKKSELDYSKKAICIGCAVALLSALFAAFLPVFVPMRVSARAFSPIYFVTIVPALLIFVFYAAVYATRRRHSKKATVTFTVLASIYAAVCVVLYCVLVPSGLFGLGPKILTSVVAVAAEIASVTFILQSDRYYEKLDEVNSVREYILTSSENDIDSAIGKAPYVYYDFLPYAQLLRTESTWSNKFKNKTMENPPWLLSDEQRQSKFTAIRDTVRTTYDVIYTQIRKGRKKRS